MVEEEKLTVFNFKFHQCKVYVLSLRVVKKNGSENYVAHGIQGKSGVKFMVGHYE